jgi:hypothetical protein
MSKRTLVPVLVFLVLRGVGLSSDWPQFLGPGRDGRSSDRELVHAWAERGLDECWRVPLGEGYSGIVAARGRVYSMDTDGREEFVFARRAADGAEIFHHEGVLFGFDNAILKALDASTGETLWRERGFGKGSLVLAAGHLILLSDRGELALAEARRDGLVVSRRKRVLEGRTWTPPTIAFGRLFLRGREQMVCLAPTPASEIRKR